MTELNPDIPGTPPPRKRTGDKLGSRPSRPLARRPAHRYAVDDSSITDIQQAVNDWTAGTTDTSCTE